jgi:hypothetical protein
MIKTQYEYIISTPNNDKVPITNVTSQVFKSMKRPISIIQNLEPTKKLKLSYMMCIVFKHECCDLAMMFVSRVGQCF